jgi:hypothetical protein
MEPRRPAYRGWSHFSLRHARVGFVQDPATFHYEEEASGGKVTRLAAFVSLSCEPGITWRIRAGDLAAFGGEPEESAKVWRALLEHDALFYERAWLADASQSREASVRRELTALREAGRPQYVKSQIGVLRGELGLFLRKGLARRAVEHPHGGDGLRGGAETTWVHLAARLGSRVHDWLDDGRGASRMLRVCELSALVFRATRRRTIHPALGRQPARLKRAGPIKRVGTRLPPANPFAPYARQVWFARACVRCGAEFETAHAATIYCPKC